MTCAQILEKARAGGYVTKPVVKGPSEMQMRVLKMICDDMTNGAIASELGKSVKTVEHHRGALNRKAGVQSPIGLYKWALASGYVEMPKPVDK